MRRLEDQVVVLEAIRDVRIELSVSVALGESAIVQQEIMLRLVALYACLDASRVLAVVRSVVTDSNNKREDVA